MKKTNQINYYPVSHFCNYLGCTEYLYKCIIKSNGYWKRIGWRNYNSIRSVKNCKYTGIFALDNSILILDNVFFKNNIFILRSINSRISMHIIQKEDIRIYRHFSH